MADPARIPDYAADARDLADKARAARRHPGDVDRLVELALRNAYRKGYLDASRAAVAAAGDLANLLAGRAVEVAGDA